VVIYFTVSRFEKSENVQKVGVAEQYATNLNSMYTF